jgi:hypothetical protein
MEGRREMRGKKTDSREKVVMRSQHENMAEKRKEKKKLSLIETGKKYRG